MKQRYEWLADIINDRGYMSGAEIGCLWGSTTGHLLRNCPGLELYAVDMWSPDMYGDDLPPWDFVRAKERFYEAVKDFNPTVLEGVSWEMSKWVDDGYLDFVFIDANHNYESVYKDIVSWSRKIRPGGMLCGHDYAERFPGVVMAVNELTEKINTGPSNIWWCEQEDVCV